MRLVYREETGNLHVYWGTRSIHWFGFSHLKGLLESDPKFRGKVRKALEDLDEDTR